MVFIKKYFQCSSAHFISKQVHYLSYREIETETESLKTLWTVHLVCYWFQFNYIATECVIHLFDFCFNLIDVLIFLLSQKKDENWNTTVNERKKAFNKTDSVKGE